jgi:hypothetical protein
MKARVLSALFFGEDPAFIGIDLMGDFALERVERALAHLEKLGSERAVWMVHPGRVTPDHPPWDDYRQRRESELDALLEMGPWLRERVSLLPRDQLGA